VGGWWAIARVEVESGTWGSMTMMGLGIAEWESRRARKRPTQPPPEMSIGRGAEVEVVWLEWAFDVVPFNVLSVDLLPLALVPFVTAMVAVKSNADS
jgi:hypothetical protein